LILTCERCETRFRLDESRLPARGARVRCSRCKHAFFVRPPGASPADAIQDLAAQAAATGRAAPEESWDLDEAEGRPAPSAPKASAPAAPAPSEFEDESDWRFEDEIGHLGGDAAALDLPQGEAPPQSGAPDGNETSFADLGDPESWDLGSSSSGDAPPLRAQPAPPAPAPRSEPERAPAPAAASEAAPVTRSIAAPAEQAPPAAIALPQGVELAPGVRTAGWSAAVALTVLVALLSVLPRPALDTTRLGSVSAGPLGVEDLRARWVENALAGPIWVVSGALRNASGERRALGVAVDVALLDGSGARIEGAVAMAQPSLAIARLRESDPDRLRDDAVRGAADLAARVLGPDERIAFDAVFASAPAGAARLAVETRDAPRPRPVAAPTPAPPAAEPLAGNPAPEG
jgi:predicted Zn finger-like uncharacterized protein